MRITSSAVTFVKANVAFLSMLFGGLGLSGVLPVVVTHWSIAIPILFVLEGIIAVSVWSLSTPALPASEPVFPFNALKREYIQIRFATEADFSGTDRIFKEYFDQNLTMNDADYCVLMRRGNIIRVIEEGYSVGSEKSVRISGYYGIWPMRLSTYKSIISGEIKEELLKANDILELDNPDATIIYLSEVCVTRGSDTSSALMRDILRYVAYILAKYPRISNVGVWPYTRDGRRWVKELRFKRCSQRIWGRRIYQLDRENALASSLIPKGPFKERWVARY